METIFIESQSRAGGMGQAVEHLSSKQEALSSNLILSQKESQSRSK
jgi:hypothetical protein